MDERDKHLVWSKVKEQTRKSNPYHAQLEKHYILPDGRPKIAYVGHHNPFAIGMALTPENKLVLVREFRPGPERVMMDLPCGSINPGEDPVEAMARELEEETGYQGDTPRFINATFTSPYANQVRNTFLIRNCRKVGPQKLDRDEFIEVVEMDLKEFVRDYVLVGRTTNAAAVFYCLNELGLVELQDII